MWAATSCAAACCATCTCEACKSIAAGISRKTARFAYVTLFGISLLLTWVVRDYAEPLLQDLRWLDTMHVISIPTKDWFQTQAVLRMSFASFAFFGAFALTLINVTDEKDVRDGWHHGGWMLKVILWLLFLVVSFLLPDAFVHAYGHVAQVASCLFLFVQIVILMDFVYSWNHAWASKDDDRWYMAMLVISLAAFAATLAAFVVLLLWFVPGGHDCQLNLSLIFLTFLCIASFTAVSLHPKVNGSLLPSAVLAAYCAYLCWAALSSEPRDYECNGMAPHLRSLSGSRLALSILLTLFSVAYSALRAGSSASLLSSSGDEPLLGDSEDERVEDDSSSGPRPVKYSYAFFHLIFAVASAYGAMMLTGWGVVAPAKGEEDVIDVGWGSVTVKFGQMAFTGLLYSWSLLAPLLLPDRDFH